MDLDGQSAQLCASCKSCCTGRIYTYGRISDDEVTDEKLKGKLKIGVNSKGERQLRFPCPQLREDGGCNIYEIRPKVCRDFLCAMQQLFLRGDISFDQAMEVIEELHAEVHSLREHCRKMAPNYDWPLDLAGHGRFARHVDAARAEGASPTAYEMRRAMQKVLKIKALINAFFDERFMGSQAGLQK